MTDDIQVADVPSQRAATIHLNIPRSDMQSAFPKAIHEILGLLEAQGLAPAGPPIARHHRLEPDRFDFDVGFPVAQEIEPEGRVVNSELPAGRVVRTIHRGGYDGLPGAWKAFQEQIEVRELEVAEEFRERYVVGPEAGPDPAEWQTELSWVLK